MSAPQGPAPTPVHIGELARRVGVSPRSLRYYEQQGLLSPARDANGYRVYDRLCEIRARNVKDLLELGLTSADILTHAVKGCLDQPLTQTPPCAAELHTVRSRLSGLDERIDQLRRLRDRLADHGTELERELASDHRG